MVDGDIRARAFQRVQRVGGRPHGGASCLALQYADYALWQRQWLSDEVLSTQLAYWKEQARQSAHAGAAHRPRTSRGAKLSRRKRRDDAASRANRSALKEFGRGEGATLFMTLLAVFGALAFAPQRAGRNRRWHAGRQPRSRRDRRHHRTFRQYGGLCGSISPAILPFESWFAAQEKWRWPAYAHQDVPFEKLVEELNPERSLSRNPLFQVLFSLQNTPRQRLQLPGVVAIPFKPARGTAKLDISFLFVESPDGLQGRLEYNADLFDRATIERMLEHYRVLLKAAVANPESRLSQLSLLGPEERQLVMVDFNNSSVDYPKVFAFMIF